MRKNKISVILACLMAMILLSLSATPVFAKELSKEDLYATETKVISEESARGYANKMIEELKDGELYIWNDTTVIDESVPMYDFEGNTNSYLFRLKTDGVKQGYIVVDARKDTAGVEICHDTDECAVDIISKQKIGRSITKEDSIIHTGAFSFMIEENNQTYKNFATDETINADKKTLISIYDAVTDQQRKNIKLQSNLNSLNAAPTSYMIPQAKDKTFFSWKNFKTDPGNCGLIASTNFLYYWSQLAPNKKPALWLKDHVSVYEQLKSFVGYPVNEKGGVYPSKAISGIINYAKSKNTPIKGDDYKIKGNIDWNFMKTNIANGNPLYIALIDDVQFGNHAVIAFGYESKSDGTYLLVASGWTSSSNTLVRYVYNGSIEFAGYVRW